MKINHIAIWTERLEEMKNFYTTYFNAKSSEKYINPAKGFESYFLRFDDDTAIEIMKMAGIVRNPGDPDKVSTIGLCHFSISVGSKERVCSLTEKLRDDGHEITGEPRTTGDGFFESVVNDIDGNSVEITV
ncbi:MAG: VOC family protein [Bacteroidales bacterium]|nr:VOC family protein [Bacteroidales bacterium]